MHDVFNYTVLYLPRLLQAAQRKLLICMSHLISLHFSRKRLILQTICCAVLSLSDKVLRLFPGGSSQWNNIIMSLGMGTVKKVTNRESMSLGMGTVQKGWVTNRYTVTLLHNMLLSFAAKHV